MIIPSYNHTQHTKTEATTVSESGPFYLLQWPQQYPVMEPMSYLGHSHYILWLTGPNKGFAASKEEKTKFDNVGGKNTENPDFFICRAQFELIGGSV